MRSATVDRWGDRDPVRLRGRSEETTGLRKESFHRGPVASVRSQRAGDKRVGRLKCGQNRTPLDSVRGRSGTRHGNPAAADHRLHHHYDDIVLRMAESPRGQESEHDVQRILAPGPQKFLDHAESGTRRNLQQIFLGSSRLPLGANRAVLVGQMYGDTEFALGSLGQLEVLELEAAKLEARSIHRLIP